MSSLLVVQNLVNYHYILDARSGNLQKKLTDKMDESNRFFSRGLNLLDRSALNARALSDACLKHICNRKMYVSSETSSGDGTGLVLSGIDFTGFFETECSINNITFVECKIPNVESNTYIRCIFMGCDFSDKMILSATFDRCLFLGCNFSNALFVKCYLERCEFYTGNDFSGSRFLNCIFSYTDINTNLPLNSSTSPRFPKDSDSVIAMTSEQLRKQFYIPTGEFEINCCRLEDCYISDLKSFQANVKKSGFLSVLFDMCRESGKGFGNSQLVQELLESEKILGIPVNRIRKALREQEKISKTSFIKAHLTPINHPYNKERLEKANIKKALFKSYIESEAQTGDSRHRRYYSNFRREDFITALIQPEDINGSGEMKRLEEEFGYSLSRQVVFIYGCFESGDYLINSSEINRTSERNRLPDYSNGWCFFPALDTSDFQFDESRVDVPLLNEFEKRGYWRDSVTRGKINDYVRFGRYDFYSRRTDDNGRNRSKFRFSEHTGHTFAGIDVKNILTLYNSEQDVERLFEYNRVG